MSMKWYDGNIAEAVQLSKQRNAIFVVYVEGPDETSRELNANLNNTDILQILSSEQFVAIKIISDSETYIHFKEIYKIVPIPSIFFIGKNGAPLKILSNTINIDDLKVAVTESLEKAGLTMASFSQTPHDGPANANIPSSSNADQVGSLPEVSNVDISKNQLSSEEQIERAKKLVEQAKTTKQQKKIEDDRLSEIERRKMGRDVQELQKWQHEQNLQQLKADRQREKNEETKARQRILDQIAQDRAERAQRFPQTQIKPITSAVEPAVIPVTHNSESARIQFRLPDGSSNTNSFKSSDHFLAVREYVAQILVGTGIRDYSLATMFPRREFSEEDNSRNLVDLNLVPTSVLLILPITSHATSIIRTHSPGFVGTINNFLWGLVVPFLGVFGYVRDLVLGRRGNQTGNATKRENAQPSSSNELSPPNRRSVRGDVTSIRRQGSTNVHRLSNNDSDDENNTWNGNSTQQM